MQVNINLCRQIRNKHFVFGTWMLIPSPVVADILAHTACDFIVLDMEHSSMSYAQAQAIILACAGKNISPIIRVSTLDEELIKKALDIGASGVQIPNINSYSDANKAVAFAKYPPLGKRGLSPFTVACGYSPQNVAEKLQTLNNNTLISIQIESMEAIEQLDAILKIAAIDIVFIGLYDLSKILNIPGDTENPVVENMLLTMVSKINAAGKCPGTIATTPKQMQKYMRYGIRYITYSFDCTMLQAAYQNVIANFKQLHQDTTHLATTNACSAAIDG